MASEHNLRSMVISIGFRIDDRALREADRAVDRFRDEILGAERSIGSLGQRVSRIGSRVERDFENMGRAADHAGAFVRDIGRDAQEAARDVTRATDRMERGLKDLKEEAQNLDLFGTIAGGIGVGTIGVTVGGDITSWAQLPRELEASLNIPHDIAVGLKNEVKELWTDMPRITEQGAVESIVAANRYFDAIDERAGEIGRQIALVGEHYDTINSEATYDEVAKGA